MNSILCDLSGQFGCMAGAIQPDCDMTGSMNRAFLHGSNLIAVKFFVKKERILYVGEQGVCK